MGISDFSKYSSVIPNPMSEKIMTNDLKQFQDKY